MQGPVFDGELSPYTSGSDDDELENEVDSWKLPTPAPEPPERCCPTDQTVETVVGNGDRDCEKQLDDLDDLVNAVDFNPEIDPEFQYVPEQPLHDSSDAAVPFQQVQPVQPVQQVQPELTELLKQVAAALATQLAQAQQPLATQVEPQLPKTRAKRSRSGRGQHNNQEAPPKPKRRKFQCKVCGKVKESSAQLNDKGLPTIRCACGGPNKCKYAVTHNWWKQIP